jgi:hypothetical protein
MACAGLTGEVNAPYCYRCGSYHFPSTAVCGIWYMTDLGWAIIVPEPKEIFLRMMPCGHLGVKIKDKWVCQTCCGWERINNGGA